MPATAFPSTQPLGAPSEPPPSLPASLNGLPTLGQGRLDAGTHLNELSDSLMKDLLRFERASDAHELIEVLAACLRHTQAVAIRVAVSPQTVVTLSIFPLDGLVHCPLPMVELMTGDLSTLRVLQVAPAALRPPGSPELARVGNPAYYTPLAPLLWAVALYGARGTLLPELAGQAAYRVAPGMHLHRLPIPAAMGRCIDRLRRRSYNLREIAEWYGIGRDRATRLLNALYLQSGLIVSRAHPAAAGDLWNREPEADEDSVA